MDRIHSLSAEETGPAVLNRLRREGACKLDIIACVPDQHCSRTAYHGGHTSSRNGLSRFLLPALALWLALSAAPADAAHHGGTYHDNTKVVALKGTVVRFEFVNPHILIYIDVKDAAGNIQHWNAEYTSPHVAHQEGWSKDMMKPGDQIVYKVHPAKNGVFNARGSGRMIVNGQPVGTGQDF